MTTPSALKTSPCPADVQAVYGGYPTPAQAYLLSLRDLIFEMAIATPGVDKLTETLKWGEPAYLTHASKSGTTIRLGWNAKTPGTARLFVHCQTSLIEEWRAHYSDTLTFEGNRAIALNINTPLPRAALSHCIAMAFTYHARKTAS